MKLTMSVKVNLNVKRLRLSMLASIRRELRALSLLGEKILVAGVTGWDNQPNFRKVVEVNTRKWVIMHQHDSTSKAGQIYNWVRLGTGLWGKNKAKYPIRPIRASALSFGVPHSPKTLAPGQSRPTGTRTTVHTQLVMHPGIKPRTQLVGRARKFYDNVLIPRTHAAAKRGLRH